MQKLNLIGAGTLAFLARHTCLIEICTCPPVINFESIYEFL
jgi:hypothetical protein